MTDRLQQKAEEIVKQHSDCGDLVSSEHLRDVWDYEYNCALAGLTAGIAMAAPEELRGLSEKASPGVWSHENRSEVLAPMDPESDSDAKIAVADTLTSTRQSIPVIEANTKFIVACVNYVREALAKGEPQNG
jgi:hypothetical protein